MKSFVVILFIIGAFSHECIHNEILESSSISYQSFASHIRAPNHLKTYSDLKLVADTSNLEKVKTEKWKIDYVKENLVPIALEMLQRRLKVPKRFSKTHLSIETCGSNDIIVPAKYRTEGFEGDVAIFVAGTVQPHRGYFAYASVCTLDPHNLNRPIAGRIVFNLHYLKNDPLSYKGQVIAILHEIIHVLAFSQSLYHHFVDKNGKPYANGVLGQITVRGLKTKIIKTPNVIEVSKKHYGCPNIPGQQIENQGAAGSAGSHWERTVLHNEMMTASAIRNGIFSKFTLAIFHDSGWYIPNYDLAEDLLWGQGKGCDFWLDACKSHNHTPEFCDIQRKAGCTYDHLAYGVCSNKDSFSDKCGYFRPYASSLCSDVSHKPKDFYGDYYGDNSKCVVGEKFLKEGYAGGSESDGFCFRYLCAGKSSVKIFVGTQTVVCTASEVGKKKKVHGYNGNIICPNLNFFCYEGYDSCKNNCNGKGYCRNKKCECLNGFFGEDCSKKIK